MEYQNIFANRIKNLELMSEEKFSIVYEGLDLWDNTQSIIKVFSPPFLFNKEVIFKLAFLFHPNLISPKDIIQLPDNIFSVIYPKIELTPMHDTEQINCDRSINYLFQLSCLLNFLDKFNISIKNISEEILFSKGERIYLWNAETHLEFNYNQRIHDITGKINIPDEFRKFSLNLLNKFKDSKATKYMEIINRSESFENFIFESIKHPEFFLQSSFESMLGYEIFEKREERIIDGLISQVEMINSRSVLLIGEEKSGKTRILKDISLKNRSLTSSQVYINKKNFYEFIISTLNQLGMHDIGHDYLNFFIAKKKEISDEPDQKKFSLFDKISNLIKNYLDENKLSYFIFIVDDIDKSDNLTIELIDFLIKALKDSPVLFILSTSKLIEITKDITLTLYLRKYKFSEIKNTLFFPLKKLEILAKELWEKSGENFFFFLEIYNDCIKKIHDFSNNYLIELKFPSTIDKFLEQRINKLGKDEKLYLKLLSFFENEIDEKPLAIFYDFKNISTLTNNLLNMNFIEKIKGHKYRLKYPLKKFIYDRIPDDEKKKNHKIISENWKIFQMDKEELVFHLIKSNNFEKAFEIIIEKASELNEIGGFSDSMKLIEKNLKFIDHIENEKLKVKCYKIYGEILLNKSRFEESIEYLNKSLSLVKDAITERAAIQKNLAICHYGLQKYKEALNILEKNFELARNHKLNDLEKEMEFLMAKNLWNLGEVEKAKKYLENLILLKDEKWKANAKRELGYYLLYSGQRKKAEKLIKDSVSIFEKINDERERALSLKHLAYIESLKKETDKALTLYSQAIKTFDKFGDIFNSALISSDVGKIYFEQEKYHEAELWFNRSFDSFFKIKNPRGLTLSKFNLAEVFLEIGKWKDAYEIFKEASKADRFSGNLRALGYDLNSLGYIEFLNGDFLECEKSLEECIKIFKKLKSTTELIDSLLKKSEFLIETEKIEGADDTLKEIEQLTDGNGLEYEKARLKILKAKILKKKNLLEEAERNIGEGISMITEIKNKKLLGIALLEKAFIVYKKDRKNSEELFNESLQIFDEISNPYLKSLSTLYYFKYFPERIDELKQKDALEILKKLNSFKLKEFFARDNQNLKTEIKNIMNLPSSSDLADKLFHLIMQEFDAERIVHFISEKGKIKINKIIKRNLDSEEEIDEYIIKKAFKEKKPFDLKNYFFLNKFLNIIVIPVEINSNLVGILYIERDNENGPFTEKDLDLLISLIRPIFSMLNPTLKEHSSYELLTEKLIKKMIGKSKALENIFRLIDRIKDYNFPVLIIGESGTGKELIAKAIHEAGNRKEKCFVPINCSAFPENLLEAELFGYAKGAFTGANFDRKGLIEEADGGTFFLDEIGDLPLNLQAKLLRALQENEIRRLGDNRLRKLDVRFISATNKNLEKEVTEGRFREDLFYRINGININVPPLRERKEDIPLLVDFFLEKYSNEFQKEKIYVSQEALLYLKNYDWPGNIRELESEIRNSIIMLDPASSIISKDLLSEKILKKKLDFSLSETHNFNEAKKMFEKNYILNILEKNNWNKKKTAEELKMTRQGLFKLLKKYNLQND
ncbi:MAG: sigma 54-interacting transcriptional regulator [Acidobacteriota bacterium]